MRILGFSTYILMSSVNVTSICSPSGMSNIPSHPPSLLCTHHPLLFLFSCLLLLPPSPALETTFFTLSFLSQHGLNAHIPNTGEAEAPEPWHSRPIWAILIKEPLSKTCSFIKVISLPPKLQCLGCSYFGCSLMLLALVLQLFLTFSVSPPSVSTFISQLLPLVLYSYFIMSY